MRGYDLTNKKTMTKTMTKIMTMKNTFGEHLQRVTLETCDLWDILSEWWEDMTWPTIRQDKDKYKDRYNDKVKDKNIQRTSSESDPRDLWPLRHFIRVMRGHGLTNNKTMTKTNKKTKTMTKTKTNTVRKHLQIETLETCDLWDIWSEWWGDMTWPTKRQWQRQIQRQRQWQRQIHLENTFRERP